MDTQAGDGKKSEKTETSDWKMRNTPRGRESSIKSESLSLESFLLTPQQPASPTLPFERRLEKSGADGFDKF